MPNGHRNCGSNFQYDREDKRQDEAQRRGSVGSSVVTYESACWVHAVAARQAISRRMERYFVRSIAKGLKQALEGAGCVVRIANALDFLFGIEVDALA